MKISKMIGLIVIVGGGIFGFFLKTTFVKASSPEEGCPILVEGTPSVVYDEVWQALEGVISTQYGTGRIIFKDRKVIVKENTYSLSNIISATIEEAVDKDGNYIATVVGYTPLLKVIRWRVKGHIHFPK